MVSPSRARALAFRIQSSTKLPRRGTTGQPAAFTWKFGTFHAYSYSGGNYIENPLHPWHELSKRRWSARQEPLWLSIVATKHYGEGNSRCVRSWLSRRLRISFLHSLQKNGYAPDGTPLQGSQGNDALYGTVQLFPERPMLQMDQKKLKEQTDKAVDEIIRLHNGRESSGSKSAGSGERSKETKWRTVTLNWNITKRGNDTNM